MSEGAAAGFMLVQSGWNAFIVAKSLMYQITRPDFKARDIDIRFQTLWTYIRVLN